MRENFFFSKDRQFTKFCSAFWPGLQVLSGDLKPAVQTHEMLYQVMQMHTFIPEAFTFDFQVMMFLLYDLMIR